MQKFTQVETRVQDRIKIAHTISVGIYLVAAIGLVSIIGGVVLQMAFSGPIVQGTAVPNSSNSVSLLWTSPGDDGNIGTAASYSIRYGTEQLTDQNWASASAVTTPPLPMVAGTSQTALVTGLNPGTTYYFGIKTTDDAGNVSALSNIPSKKTDIVACTPNWSCSEFSVCRDNVQTRSCIDIAQPSCGTDFNKPIESQSCTMPDLTRTTCAERWSCSEWTACDKGLRTRACTDVERCGTIDAKPLTSFDCSAGGVPPANPNSLYLAAVPAKGGKPEVRVYRATTGKLTSKFSVYSSKYVNGLSITGGFLQRGAEPDIVVGTGPGAAPQISVYTVKGKLVTRFFPYLSKLRTGVNVAVADVDGDGYDDLVTAPAGSYAGLVRVFRYDPQKKKFTRFAEFTAQSSKFKGGLNIASADLDRNGYAEIIAASAIKGRGSRIEVYQYNSATKRVTSRVVFSAYDKKFNNGIEVAAGDVNGDGALELLTSAAPGVTQVRAFSYTGRAAKLLGKFNAGSATFTGGADVTALDVNLDGKDEVITGTYSNGLPGVRVFARNPVKGTFSQIKSRLPAYLFSTGFLRGIRITAL